MFVAHRFTPSAVAAVKGMQIEFRECCGLSALAPMGSFGTWPIRVFRIEPNHGSVGFIGSRANDDRDCPRDADQDVASRQEMDKSASSRSVRSGYWKARFCNAGRRPFCLPSSSREYEKTKRPGCATGFWRFPLLKEGRGGYARGS
jgi:hypothetical protein